MAGLFILDNFLSKILLNKVKINFMEPSNLIVLSILAFSPFVYLPYIIPDEKWQTNSLLWFIVTFLFSLVNCIGYLIILFLLEIPL